MSNNVAMQQQPQQVAQQQQKKPGALMQSFLSNNAIQKQLQESVGSKSQQFISSLVTVYSDPTSTLMKCNPAEVYRAALKAAQLDLPIDKQLGFSYLVPFNNRKRGMYEPVFVIGYKGLIQLAMRTGQYKTINVDVVYEGELRETDKLTGTIDLSGTRKSDKVEGYFAYIELVNGFSKTLYMSLEQMVHYVKTYVKSVPNNVTREQLSARAGQAPTGIGWLGDFDSMAKKTCLRQILGKWGPLSIDMQQALTMDGGDEPAGDGTSRDEVLGDYEVVEVDTDTDTETAEAPATVADSATVEVEASDDEPAF